MRKLLTRWYGWLGLVLLLGLAGSVALILTSPNRITRANFERIQKGMTLEQVEAILGERPPFASGSLGKFYLMWQDGPSWIDVAFADGDNTVRDKELHLATVPEILTWYGKKVAAKIGVKWD